MKQTGFNGDTVQHLTQGLEKPLGLPITCLRFEGGISRTGV